MFTSLCWQLRNLGHSARLVLQDPATTDFPNYAHLKLAGERARPASWELREASVPSAN